MPTADNPQHDCNDRPFIDAEMAVDSRYPITSKVIFVPLEHFLQATCPDCGPLGEDHDNRRRDPARRSRLELVQMHWGLIPSWSNEDRQGGSLDLQERQGAISKFLALRPQSPQQRRRDQLHRYIEPIPLATIRRSGY
jgi:putative SOS response-associated peptidase YedK